MVKNEDQMWIIKNECQIIFKDQMWVIKNEHQVTFHHPTSSFAIFWFYFPKRKVYLMLIFKNLRLILIFNN